MKHVNINDKDISCVDVVITRVSTIMVHKSPEGELEGRDPRVHLGLGASDSSQAAVRPYC